MTLLVSLAPLFEAVLGGAEVARVLPVARTGVHLELRGVRTGLRADSRPRSGALLLLDRRPPRIKGGRGAWPEYAVLADRWWSGQSVVSVKVDPTFPGLSIVFSEGGALSLGRWRSRGLLHLLQAGEAGRVVGRGHGAASPAPDPGHARAPGELAAASRALVQEARETRLDAVRELLPSLSRREARRLTGRRDPNDECPVDPEALTTLLARIGGADAPTRLSGPEGFDPDGPARAGWAGRVTPDVLPETGCAPERAARDYPGLLAALSAWYDVAAEAEALDERRAALVRVLRSERRRLDRAVRAIERDERKAPDAGRLRRHAEALLCVDPSTEASPNGRFRVPDPYEPGTILEIAADPPGSAASAVADRLFAAARRQERGRDARAARLERLHARAGPVGSVLERAALAETEAEIAAVEKLAERLGLSLALERSPITSRRDAKPRQGRGGRPARRFVSPGGFEVLVGRSASQNDLLTFKVAAPDDLWLHVGEHAGAHVVVRLAGRREAPGDDINFAARLAAAFSRAPVGEAVDVHVARRKHLRRPKGGAPGRVLVRKGRTIRVRVGPRPREV